MRERASSGLSPREAQVRRETRRLDCIEAGTHTPASAAWENAGVAVDGGDRCIKCGQRVERPSFLAPPWDCPRLGHIYEIGVPNCRECGDPMPADNL